MNMLLRLKIGDQILTHTAKTSVVNIGRSDENEFVVAHEDFSRKHCQITFKGSYVFITDLGSKNGVIVNGKRIPANEAIPIYQKSKVILANFYQLMFPDGTEIRELDPLELTLEKIIPRKG